MTSRRALLVRFAALAAAAGIFPHPRPPPPEPEPAPPPTLGPVDTAADIATPQITVRRLPVGAPGVVLRHAPDTLSRGTLTVRFDQATWDASAAGRPYTLRAARLLEVAVDPGVPAAQVVESVVPAAELAPARPA